MTITTDTVAPTPADQAGSATTPPPTAPESPSPAPAATIPPPTAQTEAARPLISRRAIKVAGLFAVPVAILGLWQLVTAGLGLFAPYQLPSPGSVWTAAVELATRAKGASLADHVLISTQRVLLGFLFGAVTGLIVGALVGLSRWSDTLFAGTVGAFRAVPSLGWVPLLVLWIGINEESKVLLIAIGAFFPVYTTVASALRHVDAQLVEAGRAFGLRGVRLLTTVQLPAATPAVIAGLRLALAQAWLFLVAAELIASSQGLGFLLTDSANNGRVDRILLSLVILAILGKLTDTAIGIAEKRLLRRW